MNPIIEPRKITLYRKPKDYEFPANPAGLNRTHRVIRSVKANETQFLLLCSKIRLDEYKEVRAENQRNERRAKRQKENENSIEILRN